MKMIMAIVPRDQTDHLLECLVGAGFTATFTEGRGGVLRQAEHMLFIAVPAESVEAVLEIIRSNCRSHIGIESVMAQNFIKSGVQPVTAEVGWAMTFVWDLDRVENY
ncbi:MAG: cyclic-di-AMP receptor [Anaerolineae bacterium]|nr:cyclic-di-AMP receptor [Anaerolineae bacterium]